MYIYLFKSCVFSVWNNACKKDCINVEQVVWYKIWNMPFNNSDVMRRWKPS